MNHTYELDELDENGPRSEQAPASDNGHNDSFRSSRDTIASVESFELYTPDEERAVLRKLDWHIVAFMSFLYMLSFLDRSNIGNAKIAGMTIDLEMTDSQFEWLLTGFYITYILFEWMILLYNVLSPRVYISICVFSWGILASMQALSTNFAHMLVLRLALGVSEAAFSPGVPYYLSFFYKREELALRAGMQVSAAPLAASFAGSLAWVITKLGERSPFAPWRLLFLIEGFPSVVVAIIAWNVVPDSLQTAWFLTPRERYIATTRLKRAHEGNVPSAKQRLNTKRKVDWMEVWKTVRDPKSYLTALMFLNCNIAFSSTPVFLPSIIKQLGFTSLMSQALSAPPFVVAFVAVLATAWLSDRSRMRSPFVFFHAGLACIAYLSIAVGGFLGLPSWVRYIGIYPACAGFFSAITLIITWTMNNSQSESGRGMGMTVLNIVGQCGPLIGVRAFPDSDAPGYVRGMAVCGTAMGVVIGLAAVLRWVLVRENSKSESETAYESVSGNEDLSHATSDLQRQMPGKFVFML